MKQIKKKEQVLETIPARLVVVDDDERDDVLAEFLKDLPPPPPPPPPRPSHSVTTTTTAPSQRRSPPPSSPSIRSESIINSKSKSSSNSNHSAREPPPSSPYPLSPGGDSSLLEDFFETVEAYTCDESRASHDDTGGLQLSPPTLQDGTTMIESSAAPKDVIDLVFENVENMTCNHNHDTTYASTSCNVDTTTGHLPCGGMKNDHKYRSTAIHNETSALTVTSQDETNSLIIDVTDLDDAMTPKTLKREAAAAAAAATASAFALPNQQQMEQWMSKFDDITCVTNARGERCPAVTDWMDRVFTGVEDALCVTASAAKRAGDYHHRNKDYRISNPQQQYHQARRQEDLEHQRQFLSMEKDALDTVFESVEEHVCESESHSALMVLLSGDDNDHEDNSTEPNLSAILSPESTTTGSSYFVSPTSQSSRATSASSYSFSDHGGGGGESRSILLLSPRSGSGRSERVVDSHSSSNHSSNSSSHHKSNSNSGAHHQRSIVNLLSSESDEKSDNDDQDSIEMMDSNDATVFVDARGTFHQPLYVITEEVSATESKSDHSGSALHVVRQTPQQPSKVDVAAAQAAAKITKSLETAKKQKNYQQQRQYMSNGANTFPSGAASAARRVRATNGGLQCGQYQDEDARGWLEGFRAGVEVAVHRLGRFWDTLDRNVCGTDSSNRDATNGDDDTIHAVNVSTDMFSRFVPFPGSASMAFTSTPIPSNVRVRSRNRSIAPSSASVHSVPSDERTTNETTLSMKSVDPPSGQEASIFDFDRSVKSVSAPFRKKKKVPNFSQLHFNLDALHQLDSQWTAAAAAASCMPADREDNERQSSRQNNNATDGADPSSSKDSQGERRIKSPKSSETNQTTETARTADETATATDEPETFHDDDDDDDDYLLEDARMEVVPTEEDKYSTHTTATTTLTAMEMVVCLSIHENTTRNEMRTMETAASTTTAPLVQQQLIQSTTDKEKSTPHKKSHICVDDTTTQEKSTDKAGPFMNSAFYNALLDPLPLSPSISGHKSVQSVLSAAFACTGGGDAVPGDDDIVEKMNKMTAHQDSPVESNEADNLAIFEPALSNTEEHCDCDHFEGVNENEVNDMEDDSSDMWNLRRTCTDIVVYEEKPDCMNADGGFSSSWQLVLYMAWCSLSFLMRVNGTFNAQLQRKRDALSAAMDIEDQASGLDDESKRELRTIVSQDVLDSIPSMEQQHSYALDTAL